MSRRRKTPEYIVQLFVRQQQRLDWVDEVLRVKRTVPPDSQADHIKAHPESYWIDMMVGYNCAIEDVMHEYGCYHGFGYVGLRGKVQQGESLFGSDPETARPRVGVNHPDFAEWRRFYFAK